MWQPTREEVHQRLKQLYSYVNKYRNICDAHSVDFYLHDNWNRCLPQNWKEEIEEIKDEKWFVDPPPKHGATVDDDGTFMNFLREAGKLRLTLSFVGDDVTKNASATSSSMTTFAMSTKKSHEVERFSNFVNTFVLQRSKHICQVVDVGSGKGYLSEHLARTSCVSVVGLDSQDTNTEGAMKRNKKVSKEWKNTRRKESDCVLPFNSSQTGSDLSSQDISFKDESLGLSGLFSTCVFSDNVISAAQDETSVAPKEITFEQCSMVAAVKKSQGLFQSKGLKNSNYRTVSSEVTPSADSTSSFCPITMEIPSSNYDSLVADIEKLSDGKFYSTAPFCIVGLHACGDLTSTALKMFSCVPTAAAVCIVGCCYHHITEKTTDAGFPLSGYMKSVKAHLGRTARMLACQTLARFTETTSNAALQRIHWRAMLQVLLSRHFPDLFSTKGQESELIVGRVKKPPPEFHHYCTLALQRLGLDSSVISRSDIQSIECEHSTRIVQLQRFIRVRAVLAACIESLILLDRLLFIQEQNLECTWLTGLVQLFDPVTSPRCWSLVAVKL